MADMRIDIIITRHEEKASEPKRKLAGDEIDRDLLPLSAQGMTNAIEAGKKYKRSVLPNFGAPTYDYIDSHVSDFLRCKMTDEGFIRGLGLNPEDLRQDPNRARFRTDSRLGLSGARWDLPYISQFSNDPVQLDKYMNDILPLYFLQRQTQPEPHPEDSRQPPVLARNALVIYKAITGGYQEIIREKKDSKAPLILIVSHAPLVDAFAAWYLDNINCSAVEGSPSYDESGRRLYNVSLAKPVSGFRQGQSIEGSIEIDPKLNEGTIALRVPYTGRYIAKDLKEFAFRQKKLETVLHDGMRR